MVIPPHNFRRVPIESSTNSNNIFRSSAVDDGDQESALWLREAAKIQTYIDLRLESEFSPTSKLNEYFILKSHYDKDEKEIEHQCGSDRPGYRYNISMKKFLNFPNISNLDDYYYALLKDSKKELGEILSIILDTKNFPILITCTYGKDRTAIVCAILMKLAGCSDEEIINDYSKSEECLAPFHDTMLTVLSTWGLNERLIRSPPGIMKDFLIHLQEKYGGIEKYLEQCGINKEHLEKIRKILTS